MNKLLTEQSQQNSMIDKLRSGEVSGPKPIQADPATKKTEPATNKPAHDVMLTTTLTPEATACKEHVLSIAKFSRDKWTQIGAIAHRKIANSDAWSQHTFGNALDWHSTPNVMQQLANYLVTNAKKLNIRNVIYNRQIWNLSKGWHSYKGHPHTDHVHVDFKKADNTSVNDTTDAWKFHANVEKFGNDLLKFITTDAEKYFKKFRWTLTSWGDDEQKARAYFDTQIKQAKEVYGINDQSIKTALPQTKHNIEQLNAVIEYVGNLIINGKQGSKTIKYMYFDKKDKKWKDQVVKFTWDYM